MLDDDGLAMDLGLYLQELSKDITSAKVVEYLSSKEVMEKHGITKIITTKTADRYLKNMGYRFGYAQKGQYSDGHEGPEVVWYRTYKFIPAWKALAKRMQKWSKENIPECATFPGRRVIFWFHDETIFYAHDRRRKFWYHKDASPKPYKKGDGHSLMIADFVSADFGWLTSLDGTKSARRIIRPGKN